MKNSCDVRCKTCLPAGRCTMSDVLDVNSDVLDVNYELWIMNGGL